MRKLPLTLLTLGVLLAGACSDDDDTPGPGGAGGSTARGGAGGGSASGGSGGTPAGSGGATGTGGVTGTGGATGTGGVTGSGGAQTGSGGGGADGGVAETGSADTGSAAPVPGAPCPRCVKIFNGMNFDGWEAAAPTWTIVGGAMRGSGNGSRAAYTKADYGNVRLIVTSRMNPVNGDHLGILFWGDRPTDPAKPKIDNAGWVQWMPPFGGMWSYHPPMHHGLRATKVADSPAKNTDWHTTELLLNLDKGTLRAAVNGVETSRYTHQWPTERVDPTRRIIKGPIAMMRHGGGGSEYKDIWVEADPIEDKLLTVK
jgi:hypothetical protein